MKLFYTDACSFILFYFFFFPSATFHLIYLHFLSHPQICLSLIRPLFHYLLYASLSFFFVNLQLTLPLLSPLPSACVLKKKMISWKKNKRYPCSCSTFILPFSFSPLCVFCRASVYRFFTMCSLEIFQFVCTTARKLTLH